MTEKTEGVRPNKPWQFQKGQSGNPLGRPKDTRTAEIRALLNQNAKEVTQTLINAALGGDIVAARFVLERMVAPKRSNPVQFDMPPVRSPSDAKAALESVLEAQCNGTLTAEEADSLVRTINMYISITEVNTFADRLKALEESLR